MADKGSMLSGRSQFQKVTFFTLFNLHNISKSQSHGDGEQIISLKGLEIAGNRKRLREGEICGNSLISQLH